MENFPIPPDYCHIINTFRHKGTLRATALSLNTDPATLVRKFQRMASDYDLLLKTNNKWMITNKGQRAAQWFEESVTAQKVFLDEKPKITIATFSWLAEQKLIPHFTKLEHLTNQKFNWIFKTLTGDLEKELISGRSEFVISGHPPVDPLVAFKKISSHNWKIIIPIEWKLDVMGLKTTELISYLQSKPFLRLTGMNPVNLINFETNFVSSLQIDGVVGIRSAVVSGLGWSCLPAMAVQNLLQTDQVLELDLPTLTVDHVSLWWLRSRKDSNNYSKALLKWIAGF